MSYKPSQNMNKPHFFNKHSGFNKSVSFNKSDNYKSDNYKTDRSRNPYSIQITQQLVTHIYSTVELAKYKYKVIEFESDLPLLTEQKYLLSANFNGISSLLVFTKIRDKYYSFVIDRKTLSYNQAQINLETIRITPINIKLDNSIYNGTIMDGYFVQNKRTRERIFIMSDVYTFRGKDLTNDNIQHKISNVTSYLEAHISHNDRINDIKLTVNKFYSPLDIIKLKSDMEKIKGFEFRGYAFYPEKSGTRLIFLENEAKKNIAPQVHAIIEQDKENKLKKQDVKYVPKSDDPVYAILELRKTNQPDVYHILCTEKAQLDGKNVLRLKKLGVAYIPDSKCSLMCKNLMSSKVSGRALMKCEFVTDKNKWMPIEEVKDKKSPSLITDIEKFFDTVIDFNDCDES